MDRFRAVQQQLLRATGRDGRPAFASPAEYSSRDPRFLELDRMSAAAWLTRHGFESPFVRWYVGYATRDDFGSDTDDVSAWAMLHYFAARKLDTDEVSGSRYLVWPEGNGWLAKRLLERFDGQLRLGALVTSVAPHGSGVRCEYVDVARGERRRVNARAAVLAVPSFIGQRLLDEPLAAALPRRTTSPWLVANLHVNRRADPNRVWDSVLYDSPSLGYVDAGHQRTALESETVLTYFRAFGDRDARRSRHQMLARGWAGHTGDVLLDLGRVHPELPAQTRRVDVMLWGHAMPRPRPGFLGARPFEGRPEPHPRIAFAHVDRTGFALFEEANLHGVRAAEHVGAGLGLQLGASWA